MTATEVAVITAFDRYVEASRFGTADQIERTRSTWMRLRAAADREQQARERAAREAIRCSVCGTAVPYPSSLDAAARCVECQP